MSLGRNHKHDYQIRQSSEISSDKIDLYVWFHMNEENDWFFDASSYFGTHSVEPSLTTTLAEVTNFPFALSSGLQNRQSRSEKGPIWQAWSQLQWI